MYSRLPPPPLRAQNCLGVRILELSSAQNTKTCTPAASPPLRAQNCLEYAFWNFQAPKTLKRVFPPAPPPPSQRRSFQAPKTLKRVLPPAPLPSQSPKRPPPLRAQNWLGIHILKLSSTQNTKTCTPACPPPLSEPKTSSPLSEPKIAWEYTFWNFQAPKTLKLVLPLPPPPFSEPKFAWEYAFCTPPYAFSSAQNTKTCTPACSPPLSEPGSTHFGTFKRPTPAAPPHCQSTKLSGVRILELSSTQNTKTCTPTSPPFFQSPKVAWEYAFWNFQAPKTLKRVLPLPPPLRAQNCLEYAFWNFQAPKTLKRVLPPAPSPSESPKLPGSTHFGTFMRPKH